MTVTDHIIVVSIPAWGHLRSLVALACKIVQQRRDIGITFLAGAPFHEHASKEIERHFAENDSGKDHLRLINFIKEPPSLAEIITITQRQFETFYNSMLNDLPIECLSTGKRFHGWPKPRLIIADMFCFVYKYVRYTTPHVRIFFFNPGNASTVLRLIGPEELGGVGDVMAQARAVARATGSDSDFEKIVKELNHPTFGEIVRMPGLPPMYDYEMFPQEPKYDEKVQRDLHQFAADFLVKADGVISSTSVAYESEGARIISKWISEYGRRFYAVGPLLPPGMTSSDSLSVASREYEKDLSRNGSEIESFLNNILKSHGENSLIYMSFGSFFWPPIDRLQKFIDVLFELEVPFLLAHGSPLAVIPPELVEKVKGSKIGLLSGWAPQHLVLNHHATGWFLTHCGHNSVTEALAQGIPMIAWPIAADQPMNAAQLALVLDVGYELIQVRAGQWGLKPLFRGVQPTGTLEAVEAEVREVLQAAKGPDGEKKRHNARSIKDKMRVAWEAGGDALCQLEEFLSTEFPGVA